MNMLASELMDISGRRGIGVVDVRHGMLWENTILPGIDERLFEFGEAASSLNGNRFAVSVSASKRASFDGIEIGERPSILVFNKSNPQHIAAVPIIGFSGISELALSPNGSEMAVFNGKDIRIYLVP